MRRAPVVWSFAFVGAVGGAASASLLEPAFAIVLAPLTMLFCAILGAVVARFRYGWALTVPLVPLAGAVNGGLAAAIAVHDAIGPGAYLGLMCSVPFLVVLPPVAYVASLGVARRGSLAHRLERWRLVATTTLACTLLAVAALLPWEPAVRFNYAHQSTFALGLTLLLVATALFSIVAVLALRLRAHEALRAVPLLRASEPGASPVAQRDTDYLDLGLGTTQYVYLDPTTLLRAMPAVRVMYEGDAPAVVKAARVATAFSLAALAGTLALSVGYLART